MCRRTLFYLSFAILTLTLINCNKQKKELKKLPSATQSGQNTIGCLINDQAWVGFVSFGWWNGGKIIDIDIDFDSISTLSINGNYEPNSQDNKPSESIYLSVLDFKGIGKYNLIDNDTLPTTYYNNLGTPSNSNYQHFDLIQPAESYIEITRFDTSEKIISGIFDLMFVGHKVSHGRFDSMF